jgi:hypothetical protein
MIRETYRTSPTISLEDDLQKKRPAVALMRRSIFK